MFFKNVILRKNACTKNLYVLLCDTDSDLLTLKVLCRMIWLSKCKWNSEKADNEEGFLL